jgi:hypothetical protein
MTPTVRKYPEYQSEVADAVLPGDDVLAREKRPALSEMVAGMLHDGVDITSYTLGSCLETFAPKWVDESAAAWKVLNARRWEFEVRPAIRKALSDFFLEGGQETRIAQQRTLLDALQSVGVTIEGRMVLTNGLLWAGNWHKRLLVYAISGRPEGVTFYAAVCDEAFWGKVRRAFLDAGFDAA